MVYSANYFLIEKPLSWFKCIKIIIITEVWTEKEMKFISFLWTYNAANIYNVVNIYNV